MDNVLIFQILGVVLALFMCFLTYMNTRVWRATHVVFSFLTVVAAVVFLAFAAQTMKTHSVWMKEAARLKGLVETEEKQIAKLADGDLVEIPQITASVRTVNAAIGREVVDRGRVWRNCTPSVDANGIVVNTVPPGLPEGATPRPNHMLPEPNPDNIDRIVLHAFKEAQSQEIAAKIPVSYLGTFVGTNITATSVTLSPLIPLDAVAIQEITEPATWALYETMPVDNFDVFAGLSEDQLRALLPDTATGLDAASHDALIKSYARTGQAHADTDNPQTRWVKVKFNKPYKMQVDSDGPGVILVDSEAFDRQGRAQLPPLKRGGEADFTPGSIGIFYADDEEVRRLIADNTVELLENLFFRELNDYGFLFHQRYARIKEIEFRKKTIVRDTESLKKASQLVQQQIALKTDEKTKVTADLRAAQYELTSLTDHTKKLTDEVNAVRKRMSELYKTNKALSDELSSITQKLTEEIDAKTRAATAMKGAQ